MLKVLVAVCVVSALIGFVELVKPFQFEDCSQGEGIVNISELTVSPYPISLSEDTYATVNIKLFEDIPPNSVIKTEVYKVISFFGLSFRWRISSLGGTETCTEESCKFLTKYRKQSCSFFQDHATCACPLKAGTYGGTNITVTPPNLGTLTKYFASGDFQINMQLFTKENSQEKMIACYTFTGTSSS